MDYPWERENDNLVSKWEKGKSGVLNDSDFEFSICFYDSIGHILYYWLWDNQ